jgi:nicotinate-nucleotide--dimethylbenzimidazole phosphoribosyltransferase
MAQFIIDGSATISVLADIAGATIRLVDMAIDADDFPGDVSAHKVRRSSNRIDREDALTIEQTREAFTAGVQIADEEVDAGADLLTVGDLGVGNTTSAAVLIGASLNLEPSAVTGRGSGIDDFGWMRKVEIVRDALRRARPHRYDSIELLAVAGGADLAAMTGFLVEAAVRRTPVLLDGVVSLAAAMLARDTVYDSASWWYASHRCAEPAHKSAVQSLGLSPVLDLEMAPSQGIGALTALPLIRAAIRTLGETALLPRPEPAVPEWVPDEPFEDDESVGDEESDEGADGAATEEATADEPTVDQAAAEAGESEAPESEPDDLELEAPESEPSESDDLEPDASEVDSSTAPGTESQEPT